MASLYPTAWKRLAVFIAVGLLFSLVPVAGSKLDPKDAKESVNLQNMLKRSCLPAGFIVASQKSAPGFVSENALMHDFEAHFSPGSTQGQSGRKLLQTLSKPDQDTIRHARESDNHDEMKKLQKEHALTSDRRCIKPKGFQLIEPIEKETYHKKDQNTITHGLITVKPIELIKAAEEDQTFHQEQRRMLDASAKTFHWQTGSIWKKGELSRLAKPSSSLFGLGMTREQEQIHNVVAALRRSGLFGAIAGAIEEMNLFMLPQMATFFVPTDSAYRALKREDVKVELFQYHIVVQRYAVSQLRGFKEGDILYTLLPGYTILVTGEPSPFKIALDGVFLIAPDIYVDESIAVHGIDGVFNCTIYGKRLGDWPVPGKPPAPPASIPDKQAPPPVQGPGPSSTNSNVAGGAGGGNNASDTGSAGEAGQHNPAQQTAGEIPTTTTPEDENRFPFSSSPVASEVSSETDDSHAAISAKAGAGASAAAFVCVMLILFS